ncbi:MAG: SOS response-associated peptidase [Candidatus Sumerlaeaceae bacterium]|nr:SOS response-associated peptidase [Candidatus Sumerlaeaceae bacterium]
MCGRFALKKIDEELAELLELDEVPDIPPRYNIAPGQLIFAIRPDRAGTGRKLVLFHWGLIPPWAKDPSIANRLINARAETASEKPAFRSALKRRRCLVPADAFYEWQKTGNKKRPFAIEMKDKRPFTFGGIHEHWIGPNGEEMESVALLTTDANDVLRPIHDRMPVIISKADHAQWLDVSTDNAESIKGLLVPYPARGMTAYPVSTKVNNPRNDTPECALPESVEEIREANTPDFFA